MKSSLYYNDYNNDGSGNVYRWVRGAAPVAIMQASWLELGASQDGQKIAFLSYPNPPGAPSLTLQSLETRTGAATTLESTGLRIYPVFVTSTLIWVSELEACDNCYGGNTLTGKVFAYDLSTGSVHEVRLPQPIGPLAGASVSPVGAA